MIGSEEEAAVFQRELAQLHDFVNGHVTAPALRQEFAAWSKRLSDTLSDARADAKGVPTSSPLAPLSGSSRAGGGNNAHNRSPSERPQMQQALRSDSSSSTGGALSESGSSIVLDLSENSFLSQLFSNLYGTNCYPSTLYECIVFLVHFHMISNDLVCVSEAPNAVPGFAPPLRELPRTMFLPPNWKQQLSDNNNNLVLQYKSKPVPTKLFIAQFQGSDEGVFVTLRQKAGSSVQSAAAAPYSVCLDFAQFISEEGRSAILQQPDVVRQRETFCSMFMNIEELTEQCNTLLERESVPVGSRSSGKAGSGGESSQVIFKSLPTSRPTQSSLFHNDNKSSSVRGDDNKPSLPDSRGDSGKFGVVPRSPTAMPNEHLPGLMAAQDKHPRTPLDPLGDKKESKNWGTAERETKGEYGAYPIHAPAHLEPLGAPLPRSRPEASGSELNDRNSWRPGSNGSPAGSISSLREHGRHFAVGSDDLTPNIHPHPPGYGMPSVGSPSGGMLMGPDHPIFGQQGGASGGILDGGMGLGGVHEPRYLPVVPPSAEGSFLGADAFGLDENTLRGRGRPAKDDRDSDRRRLRTGEPNPDHLKPPGW